VTIATNMAGRGTDILLGGNADFVAKAQLRKDGMSDELIVECDGHSETDDEEVIAARKRFSELNGKFKAGVADEARKVCDAGGLYIIGTERHESRRIDNQLRGRAGRQGDPGETRFFLSLEDDLMRLFGGERIQNMMDTLKIDEDLPIESKLLTGTIEGAQKKVEARNFGARKSVLDFDDVMNRQREIIYGQRRRVLDGDDMSEFISAMIDQVIDAVFERYVSDTEIHDDWNLEGLRDYFLGWITRDSDFAYNAQELGDVSREEIRQELHDKAKRIYADREAQYTPQVMREIERVVLLKNVDAQWMDHIDAMSELKQGIYLRSYAQRDPVVEYRLEGFEMFDAMISQIREDTVSLLYRFRLRSEQEEVRREQVATPIIATHGEGVIKKRPIQRKGEKIGRNEPCPCGSGKKYKRCCLENAG